MLEKRIPWAFHVLEEQAPGRSWAPEYFQTWAKVSGALPPLERWHEPSSMAGLGLRD